MVWLCLEFKNNLISSLYKARRDLYHTRNFIVLVGPHDMKTNKYLVQVFVIVWSEQSSVEIVGETCVMGTYAIETNKYLVQIFVMVWSEQSSGEVVGDEGVMRTHDTETNKYLVQVFVMVWSEKSSGEMVGYEGVMGTHDMETKSTLSRYLSWSGVRSLVEKWLDTRVS